MTESVFIKDEWVDVVIKEESIGEDDQTEGKNNFRAANSKLTSLVCLYFSTFLQIVIFKNVYL